MKAGFILVFVACLCLGVPFFLALLAGLATLVIANCKD